MPIVERVSPLGALFINNRQSLALDRPTLLLACLCVLCTYTDFPWLVRVHYLRVNFPELLNVYDHATLLGNLSLTWEAVRTVRPEWLQGMRRGQGEDIAVSVLSLLHNKVFCCSCLYPPGWVDWQRGEVDIFRYLQGLIEARLTAEAEV